ncbi:MAG: hypothetical protein COY49_12275 [Comamonadaceae bacterium CG_4_10_14_0_8_um_filter_57_29]|nr:MAG: hypothetical protein COY49_12275 [Comamonadaceae bacterium CG_4_10_14_0_8_um_filter_57_29]
MKQHPRFFLYCVSLACLTLASCANKPPAAPGALDFKRHTENRSSGNLGPAPSESPKVTQITNGPRPPTPIAGNLRPAQPRTQPSDAAGDLTVSIEQMTLPGFIQSVYGGILQMNYSMDAAVSARTDLITFRTPNPLSAARLTEVTRQLLKSYGVAVQDFGGLIRIVPDTNTASTLPLVLRGRAQSTVPMPLRPIFHYIETVAVRPSNFLPTLKSILGDKVKLEADNFGGLLISGQPDDVQVALELVQVFDQPSLRGQNSVRIAPRFWGATEFAARLGEVLRAEGYTVGNQSGGHEPITLLALAPINSVLVFATSKEVMLHVLDWVKELDQLTAVQAGSAYFTYPVRNADAQELAKSLNDLISGGAAVSSAPPAGGTPVTAVTGSRQRRVVVNSATNSLIFQGGSQEDYRQWLQLLSELDKPVKSALIDVLVAEVALSDDNSLGFSWQLDQLGGSNPAIKLSGTTYNFQSSGAGLSVNALLGGNALRQLAISALASNSDSRVISNPKIMTRNGESASISVGQDVPVVTSQGISNTSTGFSTSTSVVPQTIQYRNTGVLLRVRPVIHAGDRIDLEISQEVSSAEPSTTGVTSSPTISKRSVETKLSLRDGATVMLAGLISETNSLSDSGVPGLKDIPGVGALFERSSKTRARTELVILITPYIIDDISDAEAATDAYQATLGPWADSVRDRVKASRDARRAAIESEPVNLLQPQPKAAITDTHSKLPSSAVPGASQQDAQPARMINLINQPAGPANDASATPDDPGSPEGVTIPTVDSSGAPAGKTAPATVNGVKVPSGATVVEDPELIRQILDATRKR